MNRKEYISIVNQYSKPIFRFLFKTYKDGTVCEDLVQEAFLKLWKNRKTVDLKQGKSWLYTTSYRLLVDHIRRTKFVEDVENYDTRLHNPQAQTETKNSFK